MADELDPLTPDEIRKAMAEAFPAPSCAQATCHELATHRFTWPGNPEQPSCYEHAQAAQRVADAMGFPLQVLPL